MIKLTFKKILLALVCLAFIASLFLVKPNSGYFNSVGNLLDSRVNNSGSSGLDFKKMRPSFQPSQ